MMVADAGYLEWLGNNFLSVVTTLLSLIGGIAVAWCRRMSNKIEHIESQLSDHGERIAHIDGIVNGIHGHGSSDNG